MSWKCLKCGTINRDDFDSCHACSSGKDAGDPVAQQNKAHWIVLVVAIIVASIGFFSLIGLSFGTGLIELAIFLAIVARIVQADMHQKLPQK